MQRLNPFTKIDDVPGGSDLKNGSIFVLHSTPSYEASRASGKPYDPNKSVQSHLFVFFRSPIKNNDGKAMPQILQGGKLYIAAASSAADSAVFSKMASEMSDQALASSGLPCIDLSKVSTMGKGPSENKMEPNKNLKKLMEKEPCVLEERCFYISTPEESATLECRSKAEADQWINTITLIRSAITDVGFLNQMLDTERNTRISLEKRLEGLVVIDKQLRAKDVEIESLKSQLKPLQGAQQRFEYWQSMAEGYKTQINLLQIRLDELRSASKASDAALQGKIEESKVLVSEIKQFSSFVKTKELEFASHNQKMETQLIASEQSRQRMEAQLAILRKEAEDSKEQVAALKAREETFKAREEALKAREETLKVQVEALKAQAEASKAQAEASKALTSDAKKMESTELSTVAPPPPFDASEIDLNAWVSFGHESKTVGSTERPVTPPPSFDAGTAPNSTSDVSTTLVVTSTTHSSSTHPSTQPSAGQSQAAFGPVVAIPSAVPMVVASAPVAALCMDNGPGFYSPKVPKVTEEKATPDDDIATVLKALGGDIERVASLTTTITVNKKAEAVTITANGNSEIRKALNAINNVSSSLSGPERLGDIYLKRLKGLIDLYSKVRETAKGNKVKAGNRDEESLYKILKRWLEDRENNHDKNNYIIKLKWKDEVPSVESVTLRPTLSLQHS